MPIAELKQLSIILGVSGGIAAYKSVELLRSMQKLGMQVRVIMTTNAAKFVGPITFEALSGNPVCMNLFEGSDRASIQHIEWARSAKAVVVAPATANIIGKLACGTADDALSTFLLAAACPILICPSMNSQMYLNQIVQQNIQRLRTVGYRIVEPESGELACGASGPGRLPEPDDILEELIAALTPKDFAGKRILITAGPTREYFDPVRFISNPSSGKMGFALARAAHHRGANVTLVHGPTQLASPRAIHIISVNSAEQMADVVVRHSAQADIVIMTAAVSDYRPEIQSKQKMKKGPEELNLRLIKNPDILRILGDKKVPGQLLIGFAAETEDLKTHATQKLLEKNLDMIVGNLVGQSDSGFDADTNRVSLFYPSGSMEQMPLTEKQPLAHDILDRIAALPLMT